MKEFLKKRFKLIIIVLLVVVVGVGGYYMFWGKKATAATKTIDYQVRRKSIDVVVSGTGTITSTSRQDISPKTSGTITKIFHSERDTVKAGDILFQLDDNDIAMQIDRTKLSIKQAQDNLNTAKSTLADLSVTTPIAGQVSNILVNIGDNVNKGQEICTVTDTSNLKFTVPFNGVQIKNIHVGDAADVFLQDYMDTVNGTVTYVSNAGKVVSGGGTLYNVEISISNPGSVMNGSKASAKIGDQYSVDSGILQYVDSRKVRALTSGTVQNINVNDQQQVNSGQVLVSLSNDDLIDQINGDQIKIQDLNIQIASQLRQQDNYKVTAVIDGTIINQTAKVGDVLKSADVIATISNPDAMQFDIPVDELDVAKIAVGMKSAVTVDALTGKKFDGVVTKVSSVGTTQNGVTTYPVTVTIQNPVDIREGMNANADIQVNHKDDILTLPITAVQKVRDKYFVFIKSANGTNSQQSTNQRSAKGKGQQSSSSGSGSGQWQGASGQKQNSSANMNSKMTNLMKTLGSGVSIKMIQVGINNDSDIEIIGGLNEGDTVVVPVTQSSSSSSQQKSALPFGGAGPGGGNYDGGNNRSSSQGNSGGGNRAD